jgi:hypothetical protein
MILDECFDAYRSPVSVSLQSKEQVVESGPNGIACNRDLRFGCTAMNINSKEGSNKTVKR